MSIANGFQGEYSFGPRNLLRMLLRALLITCMISPSTSLAMDARDSRMTGTYKALAARAAAAACKLEPGAQWWCAIAGGPGAGKSTLAEKVAAACTSEHGVEAVVLPMDGFHYSRTDLKRLDPPDAATFLPRRGAPHTFDAEGLFNSLSEAKRKRSAQLPTYSRELSDPVPNGPTLKPSQRVVFVEGNYLLLGAIDAAAAGVTEAEAKEFARWRPLLPLFDETWFVGPKDGVPEQRRRLIARHLETWSEAKTKAWAASTAEEGAAKRTDFNDVPNAHLVEKCRTRADHVIDSI